jgi:hypothetical protein
MLRPNDDHHHDDDNHDDDHRPDLRQRRHPLWGSVWGRMRRDM